MTDEPGSLSRTFSPGMTLAVIGCVVFAALLSVALWIKPYQQPPAVMTSEDRRAAIESAWDEQPRTVTGDCPTVAALEAALPGLRGVDARERDYVAWDLGVRC